MAGRRVRIKLMEEAHRKTARFPDNEGCLTRSRKDLGHSRKCVSTGVFIMKRDFSGFINA